MYYHLGAHPGFMCPVNDGENLENCILKFEKEEDFVSYEYDLKNLEFNFDHKSISKGRGQCTSSHNSNVRPGCCFF